MGKGLDSAIDHITRTYGVGTIMRGEMSFDVPVISTGCLSVDLITGVGGIPKKRITELYGPAGSGKSTLAMHLVAHAQRSDINCAYIDVEHALDPTYASTIGVDMKTLFISQPDAAEDALEITEILLRSGEIGLIVIDSVDALVPRSIIQGDMGDKHVADLPRLMSQAMRKLASVVDKSKAIVLFINQLRVNIQMMGYGVPETTSGGVALKYYASMRIDVRAGTKLKDKDDKIIGAETKIKIVKNKVASPFKECKLELIYGKGFNIAGDLLDLGVETRVVKKSGFTYTYNDQKLGVGRPAALAFLSENNTDILTQIRQDILKVKES